MKKGKEKMGNADFKQPIKTLIGELKKYIDLQLEFNKVAYRKKTAEVTGQLLLAAMLFGLFVFIMMFLSFAFVSWYENNYGGTRLGGLLWVSGFYVFMALFLYAFREPLIFSKIRKILGSNLSSQEEKQFLAGGSFSDEKLTDKYLDHLKDKNRKQENVVQQQFQKVNESFNWVNITKAVIQSGIQAFVTTRNIIQTAFQLTQKLKSKHKKRGQKELEE